MTATTDAAADITGLLLILLLPLLLLLVLWLVLLLLTLSTLGAVSSGSNATDIDHSNCIYHDQTNRIFVV